MKNLLLVLPLFLSPIARADQGEVFVGLAAGTLVTDPLEPFNNGPTAILRLGYGLGHGLALEADLGGATGQTKRNAHQYTMLTPRLNFIGSLDDLPFAPFFLVGIGATYKNVDSYEGLAAGVIPKDVDLLANLGTGIKYEIRDGVSLRTDLRLLFNQGKETFVGYGDQFIDWEWTVGIHAAFGGKDTDDDGLTDGSDQCVNLAEDYDGFEDEDGCPEADNDKDGILDAADSCPNDPEDIDAFEDEDGCPEADNDKDGILDADDRCPIVSGPVNTQGCPDSDGDGIINSEDQCPDSAGTAATNGCPDFDKDGVIDSLDECVQEAGLVGSFGCPDADADGVPDARDACADTAPNKEADRLYSDGCASPVYLTMQSMIFSESVAFINGGDRIAKGSGPSFKAAAMLFKQWPDLVIEIGVHSKAGQVKADTASSLKAASLKQAFLDAGVSADRVIAKGYGESVPVDGTPLQRVELRILRGPAAPPVQAE